VEHTDGVGAAEHVVDPRLLLRDLVDAEVLAHRVAHDVEAVLQRGEHAEAEQVELHEPHPRAVLLVPLHDGAALHAPALDRHDLADGPVGEHHASRVDAHVPRELHHLEREVDDGLGDVVLLARGEGPVPLDLLRPGVLLPGAVAERLRHVAHRELRAVLDDVGDLCRVESAVLGVHPLDDLLAAVGVEVDVDVGLLGAHAREEALEGQLVEDRVDGGDHEQVADGRVGGRATTLAQDAAAPRERDDVVHDQEVAGEVLLLDHRELALDARAVVFGELEVALVDAPPDELPQPAHRRVAVGHLLLR
jgi:hypothetical protein